MGFATNPPSKPARPQEKVGGKNAHAAKGTSTLEMVLVLPIMLMLSFGIIDYGYYIYLKNLFQGAAQSGARAAVLPTATNSNVTGSNGVVTQMMNAAGFPSANYSAQAIATGTPGPMAGFIGYSSVTNKNNTFFGGYSSAVTTSPSPSSCDTKVRVGSNTAITGGSNDQIYGDVVLGPLGTILGPTVTGTTYHQSTALASPTVPAWSPGANPGGISQTYTVSGNTTLPGGTYWFTSLTINANLTFSGATTIYVNGPVVLTSTLGPSSDVPSDLTIYQYGISTFGDAGTNGMNITARVIAPNSDFSAKNNLVFAGTAIFNSITTWNNADFYYDEQQGPANGDAVVVTVQ